MRGVLPSKMVKIDEGLVVELGCESCEVLSVEDCEETSVVDSVGTINSE